MTHTLTPPVATIERETEQLGSQFKRALHNLEEAKYARAGDICKCGSCLIEDCEDSECQLLKGHSGRHYSEDRATNGRLRTSRLWAGHNTDD